MKRLVYFVIILALLVSSASFSIQAEKATDTQSGYAQNIMGCSKLSTLKNEKDLKNLFDSSTNTVWNSMGASLTIDSPEPIGSIYIIWDRQPVSWSLISCWDNAQKPLLDGGKDGFLHEYVPLATPEYSLTLTMNENQGVIADLYVFGPGLVPDWVQQWQPMLEKADMLVFSTHADDELLWFGGTLPVYAGEYKKKVQVAYLIRHGASRKEYMRNHELLSGLWKVGVTNYPMISQFEDYYAKDLQTAMTKYDESQIVEYAVMLLRRFKPDVVIGQDVQGEYGHGVHQLCTYALQKAIDYSNNGRVYTPIAEQYGIWKIKKCYLHLYPENTLIMDWDMPLQAFGGKTGLEMAKEGYQCHTSQLKKWFQVEGKGGKYDCRKFGLYYTEVGPDINKNDFFENLAPVIGVTTTTVAPTTVATTIATTTSTEFTEGTTTQDIVPVIGEAGSTAWNTTSVSNNNSFSTALHIGVFASIIFVIAGGVFLLLYQKKHHHEK